MPSAAVLASARPEVATVASTTSGAGAAAAQLRADAGRSGRGARHARARPAARRRRRRCERRTRGRSGRCRGERSSRTGCAGWSRRRIRTSASGSVLEQCGQVGRDVAVGVADVVGDACRGDGVDALGQRDEHRVGVGHGELIGERAAPQSAGAGPCRTSRSGARLVQLPVRPARQGAQAPQLIWNGTITRSPALTVLTRSPTARTSATHSWPRCSGSANCVAPSAMPQSRSQVEAGDRMHDRPIRARAARARAHRASAAARSGGRPAARASAAADA